jgi:hypothetical protein
MSSTDDCQNSHILPQLRSSIFFDGSRETNQVTEFKLSRSALEQYIRCPQCFYLQRKLKLKPPAMFPLTLALATDALLKNEFDSVRERGGSHKLWERENINVRAFRHPDIDLWRSNFKGMRITHAATGTEIFGAVDDVWENLNTGELHIVDYKSTSKKDQPTLEGDFGDGYKRQMEIYQWLFRQAGFAVIALGYFLYVNGSKRGGFYENGTDGVIRFDTTMIAHEGNDDWVDAAVTAAVNCVEADDLPGSGTDCDNCRYYSDRQRIQPI